MAARDLAVAGAEAFEHQDYVTALDRFQRAEALYGVPSIAIMTARCLARVGRLVEAVDKYESTLRVPLDATAPEAFHKAVADAKVEVESVRARVARLELRLPLNAPGEVEVKLDGKVVPRALLGVSTPVDPGAHQISARAPGRDPFNETVSLAEGASQSVELAVREPKPAAARTPAARAPAFAPSPSVERDRGGASGLGIAFLSVGGVALAVGAVTGVVALNRQSSLRAECKPGCPPALAADLDSFRLNRTLSYVGFGVGVVTAGVGTYLLLQKSPSGEVGAVLYPSGAAVRGSF